MASSHNLVESGNGDFDLAHAVGPRCLECRSEAAAVVTSEHRKGQRSGCVAGTGSHPTNLAVVRQEIRNVCSQMVLRLDERVVGIRKISQRYPRPFSMVCADIYDVLWREASPLQHGKEQLQMAPRHRASELYSQVAQKTLNGLLHVVRRQSSPRPKRRRCSSWISRVCRSVHGPTGT